MKSSRGVVVVIRGEAAVKAQHLQVARTLRDGSAQQTDQMDLSETDPEWHTIDSASILF